MTIIQSDADQMNQKVKIVYDQLQQEFRANKKITVVCPGFKNPIYQGKWPGFEIQLYDSENNPNQINTSENVSFDA